MKRLISVLSCLVAMIFIIGVSEVSAQYTYMFRDSLGTYKVKFRPHDPNARIGVSPSKPLLPGTHDLRFSLAWGATNRYGLNINWNETIGHYDDYINTPNYLSNDHFYTFNFDYGYWATEWFSIGANVTWVMGCCNVYNDKTEQRVDRLRQDFVTVMPIIRFAWLRRGAVQLYSSLGLGLGIERYKPSRSNFYDTYITRGYCAYDLKFLGLSVGRKWFGFMEFGWGSRGVINVGFGCRINSKNK